MILPLAVAGPSAYWYLARGTGTVSLLLFTAVMVLGLLGVLRFSAGPRWPRFTIDTLHRDLSLLALALLAVHIVTSVLDGFAPIRLIDAVIPFTSPYRPLWLGLGALSLDIMLAVVITSLVRRRIGYGGWRAIHWLAYASWPAAVLHGLGTGSDTKQWWMLALTAGCVAAVVAALMIRIGRIADASQLRAPALVATVAATAGIAVFTFAGPLQPGWAARAGTPRALLAKSFSASRSVSGSAVPVATLPVPFSADLAGTLEQRPAAGGEVLDLSLRLSGGARGRLRVRMAGAPLEGGGLSLTGSQVDLLADGLPGVMAGQIRSLQGQAFAARVTTTAGEALDLHASLTIDGNGRSVTGTLRATRAGSGG